MSTSKTKSAKYGCNILTNFSTLPLFLLSNLDGSNNLITLGLGHQ